MAKTVTVQALGGESKTYDNVESIHDLISDYDLDNPSIKVNGKTASASDILDDYAFVSFGEKVKGGK